MSTCFSGPVSHAITSLSSGQGSWPGSKGIDEVLNNARGGRLLIPVSDAPTLRPGVLTALKQWWPWAEMAYRACPPSAGSASVLAGLWRCAIGLSFLVVINRGDHVFAGLPQRLQAVGPENLDEELPHAGRVGGRAGPDRF